MQMCIPSLCLYLQVKILSHGKISSMNGRLVFDSVNNILLCNWFFFVVFIVLAEYWIISELL